MGYFDYALSIKDRIFEDIGLTFYMLILSAIFSGIFGLIIGVILKAEFWKIKKFIAF